MSDCRIQLGGGPAGGARALLLLALLPVLAACQTFDESRVLQTLNQRGFGRKYVGDANEVLTLGVGDSFTTGDLNNPELLGNYTIRMDGVVTVPLIGEVFVAGFSTDEIAQALNSRFKEYYNDPQVQVTPSAITSKRYYIKGETTVQGEQPLNRDTTVWDAVFRTGVPATADLGDIYVIRADPRHPLLIPVDLQKMLDHGDSSDNILIREDDIIVINPNFAGLVKNGVELLLTPILPVLQLAISARNIKTIFQSFQEDQNFFVGNRGSNSFGGGRGGFNSGFNQGLGVGPAQAGSVTVPPGGSGQGD